MRLQLLLALFLCCLVSCAGATGSQKTSGAAIPLVTFVFDDGDDTDYLVGKNIFAEQRAVACSAVIIDWIGTQDHMTASQIVAMQDAGWEILSHTVSHPNLKALTPAELEAEFSQSRSALEGLGLTVNNIVYPFNKNNETVRTIAAKFYRSGRGGTNSFNQGAFDPYMLKSFTIKHDIELMKSRIDRAYAEKSWLILYQHEIDAKVKLKNEQGTFIKGETLQFYPSGALARFTVSHWFPFYGSAIYLVPLSGLPQPGDTITGTSSGATARIDYLIYDELTQLKEMISYIRNSYPDMRIVTIDQGLDLLGVPKTPGSRVRADN